jgi:hypothetical protein
MASLLVLIAASAIVPATAARAQTTYESCAFTGRGTFAQPLTSPVRWDRLHIRAKLSHCSGQFQGSFPVKGTVKAYYPSCQDPGGYNTHNLDLSVNHITISWSSTSQTVVQPMAWKRDGGGVQDMGGQIASGPFTGAGMYFNAVINYTLVGSCAAPPMTGITFSAAMVTIQGPP